MNDDLITMIYGEDAKSLFNGAMYIMYEEEQDGRWGLVYRSTGSLVTNMKLKSIAPLINKNETIGYILINANLHQKLFESFYKLNSNKRFEKISETPIYTNVAILKETAKISIAKCLITPCNTSHPSINLKHNKKSYIGKFSKEIGLEYLGAIN